MTKSLVLPPESYLFVPMALIQTSAVLESQVTQGLVCKAELRRLSSHFRFCTTGLLGDLEKVTSLPLYSVFPSV